MAITKIWQFAVNQFLNSTKGSFRKALKLSKAHDNYLKAKKDADTTDPDWTTLYDRYHPAHNDYKTKYAAWVASGGTLKGKTMTVYSFLKSMPSRIDQWMSKILPFYAKGTPRYTEIFPQDREPLLNGKIDARISAIESVSNAIGGEGSLAPAKALVDDALSAGETARNTQEGAKLSKKDIRNNLEAARVLIMNLQYADTGFLINKYFSTPDKILPFFDLETLRKGFQSFFKRTMSTTETSQICENTFDPEDQIRLKVKNNGNPTDKATLYLASTAGGTDSTGKMVQANSEATFSVADFGVPLATHPFLTLVTSANIAETQVYVELY